jgi:hypothetical protein
MYLLRRRPRLSPATLAAWAGTDATLARPDGEHAGDAQEYLFSKGGEPGALSVTVASRALLVAVCSGAVLVFGGLALRVVRPPAAILGGLLAAVGLAAACLVRPSVVMLVVQSGMIGVFLTCLLGLLHRLVEGRRGGATVLGEGSSGSLVPVSVPGSTASRVVAAGSDDSTAIRSRTLSTMDHVPAPVVSPPAESSSRHEPAARGGGPGP